MSGTKRFSPISPPYHRVLRALNGQKLRVRLTVPTEADTCPLTMGPVAEDELDFLPGVTYLMGVPNIRLMTLPCQHSFGAMSLIYHFANQNMLCPCCRRGIDSRLLTTCIPQHFRAVLKQRIDISNLAELREQLEADAEAAQQLEADSEVAQHLHALQTAIIFIDPPEDAWISGFNMLEATHTVDMSVFTHYDDNNSQNFASFQFRLVSRDNLDAIPVVSTAQEVTFEMPFMEHRRLITFLEDSAVTRISLVVHARSVTNRVVQLARTPPMPVTWPGGEGERILSSPETTSTLRLHYMQPSGSLSSVSWVTQLRTFEQLLEL